MKENNKSSKSTKIIFILFIVLCLGAVAFSIKHILSNNNVKTIPFTSDGYVIKYNSGNNKQEVITFNSGNNYSYKKTEDVSFNKNIISNDLVAHYQNGNILVFKNIVGLDLVTIDQPIILYYNIFKNTTIEHKDDFYLIKAVGDKEVTFNKLLLRISDNKYLLLSDTIRLTTSTNEIIEFDDYVYFEYLDGDIVSIYNDNKVYKTISSDAKLLSGDIIIDFSDKYILKQDTKYITLSNLVIDMDSNIDIIPTEVIEKEAEIKTADKVDIPESSETNNTAGGVAGQTEETVEEKDVYKEPKFKITDLKVTTIDINATIEITDDDSLICSSTLLSIVENSTSKTIFTNEYLEGDLNLQLSYSGLNPDTEYTLYLRTNFKVDDIEYSKNFISKIFRTESLGLTMTKGYSKVDSLEVDILKESFSRVSECTVYLLNENGVLVSSQTVDFSSNNKQSVVFEGLTKNTNYQIKLTDIVSNNVLVADGYAIKQKMKTLKELPTIEELKYEISKSNQQFNLSLGKVTDPDYGIKSYRYEIFDARQDMDTELPLMTFEKEDKGNVFVKIDDVKINRGVAYTYRVITTFYDNDKTIELVNTLGETMQLDGVKFPTVRFEETNVTWEQINGSLIVDDDGGTLIGNKLKVVYKNSLGTYTSKTLTIDVATNSVPININDLRANETYTFDVYASIDLQDGNGVSELTYIGSVTVKTKTPQPLMASFNNYEDYENVFAINFMLQNPEADLEASTLSEMKFTVYEGANTLGSPVASRTVVDTNSDPYQSTLKDDFYDDYTTITPNFFGSNISNKDFAGKTYTMKVTSLYDYTSYKNEIPVTENTYSFTLNGILPSLPKDPNNAITITPIPNRSAVTYGLEKDNNLDPATIIGYQIQADYVDTSETSVECEYHFYAKNKDTKEFEYIESLDKIVTIEDGSIVPKIVIPIGNGTNDDVDTDMLRRGNVYYIDYRIKMFYDTNNDDIKENVYYPEIIEAGTILRSKDISIPKQSATVLFYPATSNENTSTWKYKIKDIDNTFVENKINLYVNNQSNPTSSKTVTIGEDDFNDVTFTGVSKGNVMSFKYKENKYKTTTPTDVLLTNQYFYGINTFTSMPISSEILNNRLIVKFDDYEENINYFNLVSSVDIKVVGGGSEILLEDKKIDSGIGGVSINLYDIKDLLGENLSITLIVHFDSGVTGFDVLEDDDVLLQETTSGEVGLYYQLTDNLNIIPNNIISSTYKFKRLDVNESKLHLGGYSLGITLNKQGVSYDYMGTLYGMIMKKVDSIDINNTETVHFDYLIPQINMYKEDGSLNITPLIDGVIISPELNVTSKTTLVNNKIYLELYKTDSYGKNEQFVDTYTYNVSDFNNPINIADLENKTNYYARFYTYIDGYPQKFYLYDSESYDLGVKYHFSTLADVEITNFSAELGGSSYSGKKLTLNYELGVTEGFDYIDYEIYKYVLSTDTYEKVCNGPRSVNFRKGMSVIINAPAGSGIVYDASYKVKFKPVGSYEKDGETIVVDLAEREFEFSIGSPSKVTANISSSISSDSIIFKVAISNPNYSIINDQYTAYLKDQTGELVDGTYLSNCDANISPRKYEFKNLEEGKIYTFFVNIDVDYDNDGSKDETIYRNKSIKFGDDVSIGSVVASQGAEPNLIYLKYVDSYQISSIQNVSYTITCYKGEEYKYLYSNSSTFQVAYDSENNLYTQAISLGSREIQEDYTYFIEINYYVGSEVVAEASLTYIGAASYE